MAIKRSTIIVSGVFILTLGLSILFYILFSYSMVERVFFFPEDHTLEISGEARKIPRHEDEEANIEEYVREWILGPLVMENLSLFPRETRLNTILFRNEILYLDFTVDFILGGDETALSFRETLDAVVYGVNFNFPFINDVIFTIEGEPVPPGDYNEL